MALPSLMTFREHSALEQRKIVAWLRSGIHVMKAFCGTCRMVSWQASDAETSAIGFQRLIIIEYHRSGSSFVKRIPTPKEERKK
jgi:hypothetical protein